MYERAGNAPAGKVLRAAIIVAGLVAGVGLAGAAAADTFEHDGVRLHYIVRGKGPWLLVVHGNGGDIGSMRHQVDYFSHDYRVVAMDSRDHGQSGDSPVPLTFEAMADDLSALLAHLQAGPACVLGWSDGAIEALLLGMRHPGQVRAIVAMAPNLDPSGVSAVVAAKVVRECVIALNRRSNHAGRE